MTSHTTEESKKTAPSSPAAAASGSWMGGPWPVISCSIASRIAPVAEPLRPERRNGTVSLGSVQLAQRAPAPSVSSAVALLSLSRPAAAAASAAVAHALLGGSCCSRRWRRCCCRRPSRRRGPGLAEDAAIWSKALRSQRLLLSLSPPRPVLLVAGMVALVAGRLWMSEAVVCGRRSVKVVNVRWIARSQTQKGRSHPNHTPHTHHTAAAPPAAPVGRPPPGSGRPRT